MDSFSYCLHHTQAWHHKDACKIHIRLAVHFADTFGTLMTRQDKIGDLFVLIECYNHQTHLHLRLWSGDLCLDGAQYFDSTQPNALSEVSSKHVLCYGVLLHVLPFNLW